MSLCQRISVIILKQPFGLIFAVFFSVVPIKNGGRSASYVSFARCMLISCLLLLNGYMLCFKRILKLFLLFLLRYGSKKDDSNIDGEWRPTSHNPNKAAE